MRRMAALLLLWLASLPGAAASEHVHNMVQRSLLHLTAKGQVHNQREPVVTQGTGFFVNDEGYALTTAHLLTEQRRQGAINLVIEARISDNAAAPMTAMVIASLPELDLMLLRVRVPNGEPRAVPLETGSADALRRGSIPALMTSGFHDQAYRRLSVSLNDTDGRDVPYAWTLNVKTNGGQSGSPVYYLDGQMVRVIGLLKSTARVDDERTQMIPIDYAMPLIGHLRMDRLEAEVSRLRDEIAQLRTRVGVAVSYDPPLFHRVEQIEPVVSQVRQHISWQPELEQNGTLTIIGRRLVRDSEVPPQVNYLVTPTVTYGLTTATRTPMDGELDTPRIASDQLTLAYTRGDFEKLLNHHIQRKLGIRRGEKFTIDALEFAISLPQFGTDTAEKFRVLLGREVTAP